MIRTMANPGQSGTTVATEGPGSISLAYLCQTAYNPFNLLSGGFAFKSARNPMISILKYSSLVLFLILMAGARAADQRNPAATKSEPKLDLYGDPLPTGALARIGSRRLRHA